MVWESGNACRSPSAREAPPHDRLRLTGITRTYGSFAAVDALLSTRARRIVAGLIAPDRCAIRFNDRRMNGAPRGTSASSPTIRRKRRRSPVATTSALRNAPHKADAVRHLTSSRPPRRSNATQRSAAHILQRPLFFTFRGSRIPRCSMRGDDGSTRIPIPPMVELAAAVPPFEQHCAVVEMAPK